jgi:hypothetical protein
MQLYLEKRSASCESCHSPLEQECMHVHLHSSVYHKHTTYRGGST